MKMMEMYAGILEKMEGYEPLLKEQEAKVAEYEAKMEKIMAEMESAERELKIIKSKYEALEKMKDAYESAFGLNSEDDISNVKTEEKTETEVNDKINQWIRDNEDKIVERPVKQLKWKHKNAKLIKFDRNGERIGTYSSQAAAARAMNWDQSSISRFLKFSKEVQISKKNFYFAWEH